MMALSSPDEDTKALKLDDVDMAADNNGDLAASLPDEILDYVLSLVSAYGDVRRCSLVCKRWHKAVARVAAKTRREFAAAAANRSLVWAGHSDPGGGKVCHGPHLSSSKCQVTGQVTLEISKRYSHSAVYDDASLSMYVFGGCTSASTTFNDLWRLDLTDRTWSRPLSTGTYPSPKACAVMVLHPRQDCLLLFGGWTHPSLYPLHQSWRLFNELHRYDISAARWTHVAPASDVKPPAMAGHSATVHSRVNSSGDTTGEVMVVFGGLQKQRSNIGQFSSSNDVWCFDLETSVWQQRDIPDPRPSPRYGQSQLFLDEHHVLVMGGLGGPNNVFNDVWLLDMNPGNPYWRWHRCEVRNPEHGALHMWCHQAVRVGNHAVVLGKNRRQPPVRPASPSQRQKRPSAEDPPVEQWSVIPQAQRGVNRGRGAIRRHNSTSTAPSPAAAGAGGAGPPSPSPAAGAAMRRASTGTAADGHDGSIAGPGEDDEGADNAVEPMEISVEPVRDGNISAAIAAVPSTFRSSVELQISPPPPPQRQLQPRPSPSPLPSTSSGQRSNFSTSQPPMPRMQAFATEPARTPPHHPGSVSGAIPKVRPSPPSSKQQETRQRQLDSLRRMEDRLESLASVEQKAREKAAASKAKATDNAAVASPAPPSEEGLQSSSSNASSTVVGKCCSCHRLSTFVLDISEAISGHVVTWLPVKSNAGLAVAPEETILYSLVRGRGELIMFGGIQKDVSSMSASGGGGRQQQPQQQPNSATDSDTASNSLYFLTTPSSVV